MVPDNIQRFLATPTPNEWLEIALENLDVLLLDHANCEMKAASNAISMIYRYPEHGDLCMKMSRLAREELRHFEQVQKHIDRRGIARQKLGPGRYAASLAKQVPEDEPGRLYQRLIAGALIEARSCERFACLVPRLPEDLSDFYAGLLASESRHFEDYLKLARKLCPESDAVFEKALNAFLECEAELVVRKDDQFRFHSGKPDLASAAA
ncbi:MAG: tRNA-(ms[2]io[6]A)-hydroxylase [Pseudomonadota bacterium]